MSNCALILTMLLKGRNVIVLLNIYTACLRYDYESQEYTARSEDNVNMSGNTIPSAVASPTHQPISVSNLTQLICKQLISAHVFK